jgi:hypothetical protein
MDAANPELWCNSICVPGLCLWRNPEKLVMTADSAVPLVLCNYSIIIMNHSLCWRLPLDGDTDLASRGRQPMLSRHMHHRTRYLATSFPDSSSPELDVRMRRRKSVDTSLCIL